MPANRDQVLQAAEKYVARGKLDQALKEYLRLLDDNPKDISTLNKVGDLYVRMNRPNDSIPFFSKIAEFYARDGFFLKAIAIYKKINKIDPSQLEVYDRLADLYHKQGLTQDARSQYQVLADHYQKSNKLEEAIAAYKKMSAVDPNDLKIQVRLADLYRGANQTEQAVMQYGLIGSMLLRRGAHDEAAAVFQKALELSPHDAGIQKSLVRSLLAQKNPTAAIAILKAAPRTAESLTLLAEAQMEMGQRAEAARTAEQAIALDARYEPARLMLSRLRMQEGMYGPALTAVLPLVDAALSGGDALRAAGYLVPILEAEPSHYESLRKMAEVPEAEGNLAEVAALRFGLGREAERRGDTAGAIEQYQRALRAVPAHEEAAGRLREIGPPPPPPSPEAPMESAEIEEIIIDDRTPQPAVHAPQPVVPAIEFEPSAPPPSEEAAAASDREVETLIVEAEVFARYGLTDKAIERLRSLVRRRPDLLKARERLVELMSESKNPALAQEAASLAEVYREQGRGEEAAALSARFQTRGPASAPGRAAASEAAIDFEEFEIDLPIPPAPSPEPPEPEPVAEPPDDAIPISAQEAPRAQEASGEEVAVGNETVRFSSLEALAVEELAAAPASAAPEESPARVTANESEFVSYEELGTLLEEEMLRAGEAAPSAGPPAPIVDEQSLFADEQQFFNLAEELEKELAEESAPPPAEASRAEGEASLEEIFREFKKGVEQQLSAEDYETHFNLGIAYKEMGLIDEAIGEFQLASKDPARTVECCSMLGLCFLEKGMPQLAVKWYRKGLEAPDIRELETVGLLYDLGCVYQNTGDLELAYRTFLEVYGLNTNYRDIVDRVRGLEAVRSK
ncbi:MAG: tetratricopeptide repeat protein [Thermoanaerobaculia bacterium]